MFLMLYPVLEKKLSDKISSNISNTDILLQKSTHYIKIIISWASWLSINTFKNSQYGEDSFGKFRAEVYIKKDERYINKVYGGSAL